jgi:probable phosphoglycerate mutase
VALADKLLAVNASISHIYSSPLSRARETARIIADRLGHQHILFHNDLLEREYGVLTSRSYADLPLLASGFIQNGDVKNFIGAEGAESFDELSLRAKGVLQEFQEKHPNEHVLIVTHRYIGQSIRAVFHGHSLEEEFGTNYFKNADIIRLGE